jgi:hypothetical protein
MTKQLFQFTALGAFLLVAALSCETYVFRYNYHEANKLIHQTDTLKTKPFLKAHLKNGDVLILTDTWSVDTLKNSVNGAGKRYNFNRKNISEGALSIPIDSVAIFETNKKLEKTENARIGALAVLTSVNVGVMVFCITNPKACFGSCPTFYLNEHDNFHYADAEGFTNAISPSMQYADVDALDNIHPTVNTFSLTMKNEALETHCVKSITLLAYPRKPGQRVFHTPFNEYFLCENLYPVTSATANEGNITHLLKNPDKTERFSESDENNLSSREELFLTFENVTPGNDLGLIVHFRQTLMTTYLFYSAMGYMGNQVGDMFAKLETDPDIRARFDGTTKELGGIDVFVFNEQTQGWDYQNSFNETGPVAINRQFLTLQQGTGSTVKVKLLLNKGLWRIDYAALTNIVKQVNPVEVSISKVLNKGVADNVALAHIITPDKYLLSMPGDEYKMIFDFPEKEIDYELFLRSEGYYLEWMRDHWIQDKNLLKLKQMVDNPAKHLRDEAKNFKQYEKNMEPAFWGSRIDTKTFSMYEN